MVKSKRDSLEKFIRAQLLGPGACNHRFILKDKPVEETENESTGWQLVDIVNTTPGSIYSTAILFPKKAEKQPEPENNSLDNAVTRESEAGLSEDEVNERANSDTDTDNDSSEKNNMNDRSDEDDIYSLNQHFPNTIGISCCIDPGATEIKNNDIQITISGRYYRQLPVSQGTRIVVRVDDEKELFDEFFETYREDFYPYFKRTPEGISAKGNLSSHFVGIKQTLREINKKVAKKIATSIDGHHDVDYLATKKEEHRYLTSYKSKLWTRITYKGSDLTNDEKNNILKKMTTIERYETFLSYLEDALAIYSPKSYGFWIGEQFSKTIDLSGIDFNKSHSGDNTDKWYYTPEKYKQLEDIVEIPIGKDTRASLSMWLQVIKEHDGINPSRRYLKVQLQNSSSEFVETDRSYYSVVSEKVNRYCFFGVEIKVESPLLSPYHQKKENNNPTSEEAQLEYLYRTIEDYGVGHHCSVDWHINGYQRWIKSEFIPSYKIPKVDTIPRDKTAPYVNESHQLVPERFIKEPSLLEMKRLSTLSTATDDELIHDLHTFVDAYKAWISTLKRSHTSHPVAEYNIQACEEDYKRMKDNINLILRDNPSHLKTFRIMNSAMFIQLWHSKNHVQSATSEQFYSNNANLLGNRPIAWRPFQLAFILLNLDGIFQRSDDPLWLKRNEQVDLVWFPTGGGKTEAYLGIIALAIIQRRRVATDPTHGGGTIAIMRYTLRLLATQQFQRASRLILALEQVRQWNKYDLGSEPITIGLYVGSKSLPNTVEMLHQECLKWNTFTKDKRDPSKIPIDKCFWCDEPLTFEDKGSGVSREILFQCSNIHCIFSEFTPVILCDEQVYKTPPTLLFGTVDKFASLAHKVSTSNNNGDSRRLFGRDKISNKPPELIIQDELHLLHGPLGSAVGFFESAIDQLCTYIYTGRSGQKLKLRPKIISSTATTRNTRLQIKALYDRDVDIFPKSGINYDDSFFAFYAREKIDGKVEYISNRKYIGILPTGRTQMTTQMRLIATMFVHRAIFEKEHADRLHDKEVSTAMDYYHTIINYFNSLREVGKSDAQFYTEFTKYTRRLLKRVLRYSHLLECLYGYDSSFDKAELTGRLSGSEVVNDLDRISRSWNAKHRYAHPSKTDDQEEQRDSLPPDMVLATNMISVGIDVDRLNTMLINSMPRNIAEYIQASSRVARDREGLVVTLHNPFRLRDLSHFEKFREFHEKLYYFVEPISITPFSTKSVDRYISLYLATMIRHCYPQLANQQSAGKMNNSKAKEIVAKMMEYFETRMNRASQLEDELKNLLTPSLKEHVENAIHQALDQWCQLADGQKKENYSLQYSYNPTSKGNPWQKQKPRGLFLDIEEYDESETNSLWTVPYSLRTVESEAIVRVNENNE